MLSVGKSEDETSNPTRTTPVSQPTLLSRAPPPPVSVCYNTHTHTPGVSYYYYEDNSVK